MPMQIDTRTAVISIENFSKTFSGIRVLDGVSLDIYPGEVHGLLGENGSGKSTLIKLLAGFHDPDAGGELLVNGERVSLPLAPGQFRQLGISFVHQDLGLVSDLTVLENMTIGDYAQGSSVVLIPWRKRAKEIRALLSSYGVTVDVGAVISTLEPTERALIAIVRAVEELKRRSSVNKPALIILDEPTVFLPQSGVRRMFELIREMVQKHASVLFVSHDLDEVMEHTDRLTVLRNGKLAGTATTSHLNQSEVIEMIIGRALAREHRDHSEKTRLLKSDICLEVTGLSSSLLRNIDLKVSRGEIVGITGLMGSGYDAVLYALFGYREAQWRNLTFNGVSFSSQNWNPMVAIEMGFGLIPSDRKTDGVALDLTVQDNLMLLVLNQFTSRGMLQARKIKQRAHEVIEKYDVRPRNIGIAIDLLSGGNQQKVVLGRWLQISPELLLLDEPTQGVDIGAREQLLKEIMHRAHESNMSVICASTDYEQLERICDRVLVVEKGEIVAELYGKMVTKELIARSVLDKNLREPIDV